jgi:glucose/arabinose dehydrogenase
MLNVLPRTIRTAALTAAGAFGMLVPAFAQQPLSEMSGVGPAPQLPEPTESESATKYSRVIGWPEDRTPTAPDGFQVEAFARELDSPRWLYVLPNGDVLVAESTSHPKSSSSAESREGGIAGGSVGVSANRITLLREADGDGAAEMREVFLDHQNQPFGMALVGDTLFVGNTDGVMRFPYKEGATRIDDPGELILELPAGGYNNHWTRNVVAKPDGSKLYVSVGSASNAGEYGPTRRSAALPSLRSIPTVRERGSSDRALRNPNGMDFEPVTGALWTAVNERDGLGDDLVPDYITSVREGAFYGWPYSYWGRNPDPRQEGKRPDLVARAIAPDYALGSHTASLGLTFYEGDTFPERFRGGAFVGQRGSWNRSSFSGYQVTFVPFRDGRPSGEPEAFLTGFIADAERGEAYGRPVGVIEAADGSLLVADDAGDTVWRVSSAP